MFIRQAAVSEVHVTQQTAAFVALRAQQHTVTHISAVKRGDRVAQLILEVIQTPEVEEVEELPETVRGAGGYGSTGVNVAL